MAQFSVVSWTMLLWTLLCQAIEHFSSTATETPPGAVQLYNLTTPMPHHGALAPYIYKIGTPYGAVPVGLAAGAASVVIHRVFYQVSNRRTHPFLLEADGHLNSSSCPRSESSTPRKSTYRSSSNTPVTFPTTKARPVSSSPGSPPASTFSIISETIDRGLSGTIRTWLRGLSMALVWRFFSYSHLPFSGLLEFRTHSRRGGEITKMGTMIGVQWQNRRSDFGCVWMRRETSSREI